MRFQLRTSLVAKGIATFALLSSLVALPLLAQTETNTVTTNILATSEAVSAATAAQLLEPRAVGRAKRPSTRLGLLFHAAEHCTRHAGQAITTARILQGG